jgi:hypothetical protein
MQLRGDLNMDANAMVLSSADGWVTMYSGQWENRVRERCHSYVCFKMD